MPVLTLRGATCALLLTTALLGPTVASAAPERADIAHPAARTATTVLSATGGWWQRLIRLLTPEGCAIDPHGLCAQSPNGAAPIAPKATLDEGCMLDPHGICSSSR